MRSLTRFILLLLFLIVHLLDNKQAQANYAFGDSLFEDPKPNFTVPNQIPQEELDEFSQLMHQCVETLCEKTEPEKTFKQLYSDITYQASQSDFYENEIKPLIEKARQTELQDLRGMETFLDQLANQKKPLRLDMETRKAIAVLKLSALMSEHIPTIDGVVDLGPLRSRADFGSIIGRELDIENFNRLVEDGTLEKISLDMAQSYLLNRNFSSTFPFIGNSDNPIANLISNYGKGARGYLLSHYDEIIQVSQIPGSYVPQPMIGIFDTRTIKRRKDFFDKNFDSIVRFASLTPFTFGLYETDFGISIFDNFMISVKDSLEDYAEKMIPETISLRQVRQLEKRVRSAQESLIEQLEEENFHGVLTKSCEWKLNYLREGLPTEEQLKKADQQVSRAMVEFQSWVYQNFSDETATSVVNFIKSWEFFYPPTQEEFASVIKEYIEIRDPRILYNYTEDRFDFLAAGYSSGIYSEMEKSSALEKIEILCETLNIRPVSDRASTVTGQVYLSWMALKDRDLTRSVVWHELGHVLSGLIRGDNQWNVGKKILGEEFKFSMSVDSFLHYVEKRQCLGSNQEQGREPRILDHQFLEWAKAGELAGYFDPELVIQTVDPNIYANIPIGSIGIMKWQEAVLGSTTPLDRVGLTLFDGSLTEEDWADWVASSVGKNEGNHFCFMLKDRDNYYWDTEKKKQAGDGADVNVQGNNNETVAHSTLMYRLLNTHINRAGILPKTCRQFMSLAPKYKNLKACD